MRYLIVLLLHVTLFASSYDFYEYKFIFGVNQEFKKTGNISFEDDKTIITYSEPKYKQIISHENNISIAGSSGKIYMLKGKALFYTKLFIDVMVRLDNIDELKSNIDFEVTQKKNKFSLSFNGDIADQIIKAIVQTKDKKVVSFKLFLKNSDTLEIVKR